MRTEVAMFTVRNTLFGAALCALLVWLPMVNSLGDVRAETCFSVTFALFHVWFLLAHLHLRRAAREGRPAVWPTPST
jgi:hypothetical protein